MRTAWLAVPMAVLTLAGCGLSTRDYVERHEWPLQPDMAPALAPPPGARVLLVRKVAAGPLAKERGLQTVQPDGSVQLGFYDEWAAPPAEAAEAAVRAWLAGSGLFSAVLAPGSSVAADFVLEGELTALVAEPSAGRARVTLGVVLLDQRQGATKVRLQRTVTATAPLASDAARDEAAAMNAALA